MAQRYPAASETDNVTATPAALKHLQTDPTMAALLTRFGPYSWKLGDPFGVLVRAVVGQLISGAAARAVYGRLEAATGIGAERILACTSDELLALGVPRRKAEYLHGVAALSQTGGLDGLEALSDTEVTARLTSLKGVGVWTAEMFLIFALGRPDIWPLKDMGVVRAGEGLYGAFGVPALTEIGERFAPHRSAAVWYLWRWIEAGGAKAKS